MYHRNHRESIPALRLDKAIAVKDIRRIITCFINMTKRKHPPIEPKPTSYGGVTFRSRLEARWAVFFDFCPNVLNWAYEPTTFTDTGNRQYTPDFEVKVYGWGSSAGRKDKLYVEVKPTRITTDHLDFLKRMTKENKFILFIVMGDFYEKEIASTLLHKGKQNLMSLDEIFRDFLPAANTASKFRFDIKR